MLIFRVSFYDSNSVYYYIDLRKSFMEILSKNSKSSKYLLLIVVVVVRIDCNDQMSRDEVISLRYNSFSRVNVRVSAYFVPV